MRLFPAAGDYIACRTGLPPYIVMGTDVPGREVVVNWGTTLAGGSAVCLMGALVLDFEASRKIELHLMEQVVGVLEGGIG